MDPNTIQASDQHLPDLFRQKRRKLLRARLEYTGDDIEPNWYVDGVGFIVRPAGQRVDTTVDKLR